MMEAPPLGLAAVRLLAVAFIFGFLAFTLRRPFPQPLDVAAGAALGLLLFAANNGLSNVGAKVVPSGLSAILYSTIALQSGLLAPFITRERLEKRTFFWSLIGFFGIVLAFYDQATTDGELLVGSCAILLSATASAVGWLIVKRFSVDILWLNCIGAATGASALLALSSIFEQGSPLPVSWMGWGSLLYLILGINLGAYLLYAFLVKRLESARAAYVFLVYPIGALMLGSILLQEALGPMDIVGALLVGGAGLALTKRPSRAEVGARGKVKIPAVPLGGVPGASEPPGPERDLA